MKVTKVVLGILPPIGGSLTDLRKKGQLSRLIDYYFKAYAENFDKIYYFSYYNEKLSDFIDDLELLKRIEIIPKKSRLPNHVYALLLSIIKAKHFRRCDVFRAFQTPGTLPLVFLHPFARQPCLATYGYNYSAFAEINGGSKVKVFFVRFLERLSLRRADRILITNKQLLTVISKKNQKKVVLIPNGVDTAQFRPRSEEDIIAANQTKLIFIGRLAPQKNLARFFEAISIIKEKYSVKLILIGTGKLESRLRALVKKLDIDVDFKGIVNHNELPAILNAADIFVLPSLSEGHPKALIEAMSCGLPCVVSNGEGTSALIDDNISGLLVDPKNVNDIADKISRLIENKKLAKKLGSQARDFILTNYDINGLIDREMSSLKSITKL